MFFYFYRICCNVLSLIPEVGNSYPFFLLICLARGLSILLILKDYCWFHWYSVWFSDIDFCYFLLSVSFGFICSFSEEFLKVEAGIKEETEIISSFLIQCYLFPFYTSKYILATFHKFWYFVFHFHSVQNTC